MIIGRLGLEGYGVWTLLFSVVAYVTTFETSFGNAYSKYTAEYSARGDYVGLSRIVGSGLLLVGSVSLLALGLLAAIHRPVLAVLNVPSKMMQDASVALLLIAVSVLVRMSVGCVFQILGGLQRLDLRYKLDMLDMTVGFVLSLCLLLNGWGLVGLAVAFLGSQLFVTAMAWRSCRRLCPELRITPMLASREGMRKMISLGGRFQLILFLQLVFVQGLKMLISGLLGTVILAIYDIAYKLLNLGAAFAASVVAPLMPAFANLHAKSDRQRWSALLQKGLRMTAVVAILCYSFLFIFADQAILTWTGRSLPLAVWTLRCLSLPFLINVLTGVGTASLRGQGTVRLELRFLVLRTSMLVLLSMPGYWWLGGYKGLVYVSMLSILVGAVFFFITFAKSQSLSVWQYLGQSLGRPVVVLLPIVILVALLQQWITIPDMGLNARWTACVTVLVWGVFYAMVFGAAVWLGVLRPAERSAISSFIHSGRRREDARVPV